MEPILWMTMGAAGAGGVLCVVFAAKHGWAALQDKLNESASAAEADFKAKVRSAVGEVTPPMAALAAQVEQRLKAALDSELAAIKADIAALKNKVIL